MTGLLIAPILKELRNYSAQEWEIFIEEWVRGLEKKYFDVKRLGSPGDLGRDVVGFGERNGYDGPWDLYSCKHYETPLKSSIAGIEIAKIIYHCFIESYSVPRQIFFIAPRDVSTELGDLLGSPSKLRLYVLDHWDTGYSKKITDSSPILLSGKLADYVDKFDYSRFHWYQTSEAIRDHQKTAYWASRFGGKLPPPPTANVPASVLPNESTYVGQLLLVYGEQEGCSFADCDQLGTHPQWQEDFERQRERFYQAEAFVRAYRDETPPGTVEQFTEDIHDAIEPVAKQIHAHGLERLNRCLAQAAQVAAGGILAQHARPRIKQGACHQLANSSRIKWIA